jgi:hypothetical protein
VGELNRSRRHQIRASHAKMVFGRSSSGCGSGKIGRGGFSRGCGEKLKRRQLEKKDEGAQGHVRFLLAARQSQLLP